MRVLITGGAGFIGSHLTELLLEHDHEVVVLDNFLTGSQENVRHLVGTPGFRLVDGDVIESLDVGGHTFDCIAHLASPASPSRTSPISYLQLPIETLRAGSIGTLNGLELARRQRARFVLASTSEVYGDPEIPVQDESYAGRVSPVAPRSVYDEAKRFAEAATMAYRRRYDVSVGIVRIFNTYGPRMRLDDGRVVPAFIDQALRNASLTVCGDGSQTRSFCYVSDLVEGVRRVIENPRVTGPINIGNPEEVSVLDLAHRIRDAVGSRSEIVFTERPEGDPMQRRPSIARARAELDWEPRVALAAGLATTIEHYRALATRSSGADAQRDAGRR